jgi:DNA-binding NarL/FixJ family response regulator
MIGEYRQRRSAAGESLKDSAQQPVRVLLVEDSAVLIERLAEVIRQNPEVEIVGSVDTEDAARALLKRERIDVMVLDLHLRQGNGFGVLRAVSKSAERPLVVVLTNYDLPQYKDAALALGAAHFMDKIRDYDKFPDVMHELVAKVRLRA